MFRQNKRKQHLEALATALGLSMKSSFGQTELTGNYQNRDIRISTFSTGAIGSGGIRFVVDASDWSFGEFRVGVKARAESSRFPDGYDITADNPIEFSQKFQTVHNLQDFLGNPQQRLVFNGNELEYITTEKLTQEGIEEVIAFLYAMIKKQDS